MSPPNRYLFQNGGKLKYLVEKQFKKVELSENTLVYTTFKTCDISIKLQIYMPNPEKYEVKNKGYFIPFYVEYVDISRSRCKNLWKGLCCTYIYIF